MGSFVNMKTLQLQSGLNLFDGLNKFRDSSAFLEAEFSNNFNTKVANQNFWSKFNFDAKKPLLILVVFFAFFSNTLKAQFFFNPGWGSAPCTVDYRVYDASSTLILGGVDNTITFPFLNPPNPGNSFSGIPSYEEYRVNGGAPITVVINSTVVVSLPCLGGAFYTFKAYFAANGLGCPQETLLLYY